MARNRRRWLRFVGPLLLMVAGGAAWLVWPRSAITADNVARIQSGMTVAEVEAILGGPARDESESGAKRLMIQSVRPDLEWISDQVSVWVYLDADGRVKEYRAILVPAPGPLATLRRWLRLCL